MKKLIQSASCGIMGLASGAAMAHDGHGATLLHLHAEEWAMLIVGVIAIAGLGRWLAAPKKSNKDKQDHNEPQ